MHYKLNIFWHPQNKPVRYFCTFGLFIFHIYYVFNFFLFAINSIPTIGTLIYDIYIWHWLCCAFFFLRCLKSYPRGNFNIASTALYVFLIYPYWLGILIVSPATGLGLVGVVLLFSAYILLHQFSCATSISLTVVSQFLMWLLCIIHLKSVLDRYNILA